MTVVTSNNLPAVIDGLLTVTQQDKVIRLICSRNLHWALQNYDDRASRGTSYQLASSKEHDRMEMLELAHCMASIAYDAVADRSELAVAQDLTPQVFPVIMIGNRQEAPHQRPHQDGHDGPQGKVHPLLTLVYYALLDKTLGGHLVGLEQSASGELVECFVHRPEQNQLVVMCGHQLHKVEPLWQGLRISIVINFYDSDVIAAVEQVY
jgi:hypothetical protein